MTCESARVDSARSAPRGGLPSDKLVLPPTGITDCPSCEASARMEAISSADCGVALAPTATPSMERGTWKSECIDAVLLGHGLHAKSTNFSTHVALREDFFRVEHAGWVKAVLEPGHRCQI